MDIFTTKESAEIADHLTKRNDVIQAQVTTTEDRGMVGGMLNKHDKQQTDKDQKKIAESEKSVQKLEPDKEIIVNTYDAHWNQLKDLNSSLKQSNAGENVEKYIEKFLNVDVKDKTFVKSKGFFTYAYLLFLLYCHRMFKSPVKRNFEERRMSDGRQFLVA